jgi:hypothetical protein
VEERGFACTQHANQHLSWWMQKHLAQHHGISSSPHHEHNKEGKSPQGLEVGHRCNVTTQRPMDGKPPTWCALWRRKYWGKKGWRGGLITRLLLPALHKTSNVHTANPMANKEGCWKKNVTIFLKCFLRVDVHPFTSCSKARLHDATTIGRSTRTNLKWAWNVNGPKLLSHYHLQ